VAQLGFGFVVTLSSDSSDIITAIETGLGSFSESSVENAIGTAFADTILGNALDNTLDGAAGADTMTGGAGNDTYLVDNAGDVVVEDAVAFSYDGVVSSAANYTLALNVESLQLALSAGDINGTGNAQNNDIYGNDGHNVLNGGDGDDYVGGDTTEIIGVSDTVHGGAGNDTVDGWGGADQVFGDEGDDVVEAWGSEYTAGELSDGGAGTDTLRLYALETVNTIDLSIGTVLNFERLEFGSFSGSLTVSTTGAQALSGFAANTVVAGSGATDTLIINNATTLNLSGWTVANWTAGVDTITINGTSAANNITGTGAGDWINGGVGADTMNGAGGDDTFVVDNAGDVVTEALNAGTDTVRSLLSFTLGANVENLIITGVGGLSGTGNNLNNVITGNAGGNTLDGKAGADTMIGGLGNDIYLVDNAGDVVTENVGEGTDTIRSTVGIGTLAANVENLELQATAITGNGNELDNRITGNASANNINGGLGADTMLGGLGNDTYFVDNIGDVVNEASGEGTDTIFSTINIALLATNVENLSLNGVAAVTATGNALNNVITGNSTNNVLNGGAGEDTLNGGLGNDNYVVNSAGDVVNDTGGNADTITSFIDMATLTANIENLTLAGTALIGGGNGLNNVIVGNSLANTLSGGAGNDQLNGGVGADTMSGGLGDDSYLVENAGDVVTENSGEGSDTVYAFINITLAANVEKLNLMPQGGAINGTANGLDNRLNGNDFDNVLTALGGNDVIQGLGGADHIIGGAGQDNIFGGSGNDVFVYQTTSDSGTTGATRDLINDFVQGQDHIDLSAIDAISGGGDDAFSFIGAGAFSHVAGQLRFEFVDAVGTANDYTIISMDVNGDAAADSQIALRGLVMLTGADFVL
ncbi:MAG: calcium-binding protein, partial [Pseudomonadota bacterium]